MFDITKITQQAIQAKLDTNIEPMPEDVYTLQVMGDDKGLTWRSGMSTGKDGAAPRPWVAMDLRCRIVAAENGDLASIARERGRDPEQLIITHGLMLDVTDQGALDIGPGRNTQLGALREAVGQNNADNPWHYDMLKNTLFKAKITIKVDKDDPNKKYNRFVQVAAA